MKCNIPKNAMPNRTIKVCSACGSTLLVHKRIRADRVLSDIPPEYKGMTVQAVVCDSCGQVLAFKKPDVER